MHAGSAFAQRHPRLSGFFILLLGVVCLGANVWMIQTEGKYYGKLFILGCPMVPLGLLVMITGIMQPPRGAPPAPLWWRVASWVLGLSGLGLGLYLAIQLGR